MTDRTNTLRIQTPEGIVFSLVLAGPVSRFLAWAVDLACVGVAMIALGTLLAGLQWINADLMRAASVLAYFVLSIGYGIVLEWYWRGQTIGKRVLRLRVIDAEGLRLQSSQVVVRNLLRFIDALPAFYLVGGLACLMSRRAQRLGDFAANTVVVHTPRQAEPDLDQVFAGKYNSFRAYPHIEARLRQRISPAEGSLALQAVLRRDEFDANARIELFAEIAGHFRSVAEFPPEATEGLTDEQHVRNTVEVLFRPRKPSTLTVKPPPGTSQACTDGEPERLPSEN
jgi:uncharacterized RDD family membrane protein YckC